RKVRGDVEKAKRNGTTFAAADANKNNKAIFGYGIEDLTLPATPQAQALDGSYAGFSPKPAVEIVIVAMKPLETKTYVDQALKNGKGVTFLDEGRIPHKENLAVIREGRKKLDTADQGWGFKAVSRGNQGRFPANLLCGSGIDVNLEALIEAKNKL
ncbi:unnamed protein product, partial [marine sediment metagenome]